MSAVNHTYAAATDAAGTGLFASKDIAAGELILQLNAEETYSVLDLKNLDRACENCFLLLEAPEDAEEISLMKCSGCERVKYCGHTCQRRSWKDHHKYECKIFKRLQGVVLANTVRLMMRILLRRKNNVLLDAEWEAMMKTQHHLDDFKEQKHPDGKNTWENIQLISRATLEYSGSNEDIATVESIMCRSLINSHTLVSPAMSSLGICFAPSAALLNHSCNPNAAITFSGPIFSLRALVPIAKSSEVFISYINNTYPPSFRQAELKSRYFFTCPCPECSASPPTTLGRVDPPPELLAILPAEQLEKLDSEANELRRGAQKGNNPQAGPNYMIEVSRKAMEKFSPIREYPPYRQPYASIRFDLINSLTDKQQWVPAFVHYLIIYFHIDPVLYPQAVHPVRVVHKWALLKLTSLLAMWASTEEGECRDFEEKYDLEWIRVVAGLYLEIEESVKGSHGTESRFAHRIHRDAMRFRLDTKPLFEGKPMTVGEMQREWRTLRRVAKDGLEGRIG